MPPAVRQKLYKSGQTRGATPAEIFQNRVLRHSTVLIPYSHWDACKGNTYENGSIVLISPEDYFRDPAAIAASGLVVGRGALVFYTNRSEWTRWPPRTHGWAPATSRLTPQGGEYVARISGTTATPPVESVRHGFTTTDSRGAGIRVYEYAPAATIAATRIQLEALMWRCHEADATFAASGMAIRDIASRRACCESAAGERGLLDAVRLRSCRALDADDHTVCPLCLEPMSAEAFTDRVPQAGGREKFDTRITEGSLFHVLELRVGELGHRPYNLGWGHHHCNVVAKDAGIPATLDWIRKVAARNAPAGA